MPDQPEYEYVQVTRVRGRGLVVDTAPRHTKITLGILADGRFGIHFLRPDVINLADQVIYRITGWDPTDSTLTLELVEDWRPGTDTNPNTKA